MPAAAATKDSTCMLETASNNTDLFQEEETGKDVPCGTGACVLQIHCDSKEREGGKKLQGQCLRIVSPESPAKLSCCYAVITVLTAAVIALSVALSVRTVVESSQPCYATCPSGWIGFESKCFYFSEDMRNWTFSQTFCTALEAHLARFESKDELNFLKRYKGDSDHWMDLHRESPEHPWMWTDNTEYNNLVPIRGEGKCGYLSDNGISSGRSYTHRKKNLPETQFEKKFFNNNAK
ncbi:hypothetical protein STEG23_028501 [Scotinomys teguina]